MHLTRLPLFLAKERELVYAAEQGTVETIYDLWENAETLLAIEPDEAERFCSDVASATGWTGEFRVVFDGADSEDRGGWVDVDGTIHLDPRILDRWIVLHELAHALDTRDGHGAIFRSRLAALVEAGLGGDVADVLRELYEHHGVAPASPHEMPDLAEEPSRIEDWVLCRRLIEPGAAVKWCERNDGRRTNFFMGSRQFTDDEGERLLATGDLVDETSVLR